MVAPVAITQSVVPLKVPLPAEVEVGALAVNITDGALYSKRHDGSIIRIEGDTGNGTIASTTSLALGAVMGAVVDVTGSATISAIVLREGQTRTARFSAGIVLVNSSSLQLLGGADVTAAAGDYATFRGYAGGVVRCTQYSFASPPALTVASINKVQITQPASGAVITIANGKTLTVSNTLALSGNDGAGLNVGGGGTLGSAAFTPSSSYMPAPGAYALAPVATDPASTQALANSLRGMAIAQGLGS